jgi:hypothetical protein
VAVLLRVRAVAVTILEIGPEVLDGLAAEPVQDASVDRRREVFAQTGGPGEIQGTRGVLFESPQGEGSQPGCYVGLEEMCSTVDGMDRLAASGLSGIAAVEGEVGNTQALKSFADGIGRQRRGHGGKGSGKLQGCGSGEIDYGHVSVGGSEPAEIIRICRQDETTAELYSHSDDMGISQVLRARLSCRQNAPYDPGQRAIRVAHPDPCLARQTRVHQRVVPGTAIKLGQDHARDDDLSPEAHRCTQSCANFQVPASGLSSQSRQGLGI